jgi:hypothetical protein
LHAHLLRHDFQCAGCPAGPTIGANALGANTALKTMTAAVTNTGTAMLAARPGACAAA